MTRTSEFGDAAGSVVPAPTFSVSKSQLFTLYTQAFVMPVAIAVLDPYNHFATLVACQLLLEGAFTATTALPANSGSERSGA